MHSYGLLKRLHIVVQIFQREEPLLVRRNLSEEIKMRNSYTSGFMRRENPSLKGKNYPVLQNFQNYSYHLSLSLSTLKFKFKSPLLPYFSLPFQDLDFKHSILPSHGSNLQSATSKKKKKKLIYHGFRSYNHESSLLLLSMPNAVNSFVTSGPAFRYFF